MALIKTSETIRNQWDWDPGPIEEVRREKDKFKDSEDLEGLKDLLENVILKASHFPLEFIQNAEDEESSKVGFYLYESGLIIYNDGKPFRIESNRNDIKGFCSIGISQKYKKGIGFLGVGAKTIFKITKKPWLVSGRYNFTIEDMLYPSAQTGMPPYSTDVLDNIDGFPHRGAIFYSPLLPESNGKHTSERIGSILGELDQSIIMFLNSIESIEVKDFRNGEEGFIFRRKDIESFISGNINKIGTYICKRVEVNTVQIGIEEEEDEFDISEWIVGSFNIRISEEAKTNLPKSQLFDKKRASRSTRISIAFPLSSNGNHSYPLYCYLPLSKSSTGFPFIFQGDFIPTADRQHIQTDLLWNKEILQNLGVLLSKIIETCVKNRDISYSLEDLIPFESDAEPFLKPLVTAFKREFLKTGLMLGNFSKAIKLKEVILCDLNASFLSNDDLRSINLGKYNRAYLELGSRLRKGLEWIGVRKLTEKDVFKSLLSKREFKGIDPSWVFKCYYFFAITDGNIGISELVFQMMQSSEWLFTNRRTFTRPHDHLYFRMPKAKSEIEYIEDFIEVQFLHPIFTLFSGSRRYGVDSGERDIIRRFLIERFSIQILEDEGHLIKNLVIPLLESNKLSQEKRIQYFTAFIYYQDKLQKKLMKDGGYRNDLERGQKRLKEVCRNIMVPGTTFKKTILRQSYAGLKEVKDVYLRGKKDHSDNAFKIFHRTSGVYFLSPTFERKVQDRLRIQKRELANALENIGLSSILKIVENHYSKSDDTPFWVDKDLVSWKLTDYEVPGLNKIDQEELSKNPIIVKIILKDLANKYKDEELGTSFLKAIYRSSRSGYDYKSSAARILNVIELIDEDGNIRKLQDYVQGHKFKELIPNHRHLLPFDTKGMDKFLNALELRDEPTEEELIAGIAHFKTKYEGAEMSIPRKELLRLCNIYEELTHYESHSPEILLLDDTLGSYWFMPQDCYWADPTTQFRNYYPVIGDFYKALGKDHPELFQELGVNMYPSVEDVFRRLSILRTEINRSKRFPTYEEITEIRWYYKFLAGNSIPRNMITRKIFLTDSGRMVNSQSVFNCTNVELHKVLSKRMPSMMLSSSIIHEFPNNLKVTFGIVDIESYINPTTIPQGTKNNDLTILFRLLLKMVATYEHSKGGDLDEQSLVYLQNIIDNIEVIDVPKIEIDLHFNRTSITAKVDTLFLDTNLYLTNIKDDERILSRIRQHAISTIFRGYTHDTINFANELIINGLDIDSIQVSFFRQGFSKNHISQFLKDVKLIMSLQQEDEEEQDDTPGDLRLQQKEQGEEQDKNKEAPKKDDGGLLPQLANPFEYEAKEVTKSKLFDDEGKEVGFRKKQKVKRKKSEPTPPPTLISNLGIEEIGIEFVKIACRAIFNTLKEEDIKDVHMDLQEYDIVITLGSKKIYIEVKASLSDPIPRLSRDQFDRAKKEKENYYIFLVGNIQTNQGDVYVRYIPNPASHQHVRLGGARLKGINWDNWGSVRFTSKSDTE